MEEQLEYTRNIARYNLLIVTLEAILYFVVVPFDSVTQTSFTAAALYCVMMALLIFPLIAISLDLLGFVDKCMINIRDKINGKKNNIFDIALEALIPYLIIMFLNAILNFFVVINGTRLYITIIATIINVNLIVLAIVCSHNIKLCKMLIDDHIKNNKSQ